jgi:GT2 family glycosyltransferase
VCIPVHGRFDLLRKCLEYIPDAFGDITYQIYIFDNGSPKEEADLFYPVDRSIKVIRSKENIGFPRACNRMVAAGRSPLIFLLNSDVMLAENSVDLLVREMDNPDVGVVGMRLVFPIPHRTCWIGAKSQTCGETSAYRAYYKHPWGSYSPLYGLES